MGKKLSTQDFVKRAEETHGKVYDYSLVNYDTSHTKVTIVCRIHGEFSQAPFNHLNGHGCSDCRYLKVKQAIGFNREEFITKAISIHGDKYDYSSVDYKGSRGYVDIVCASHGTFSMEATAHTNGKQGCPKCGNYNKGWTDSKWDSSGGTSPHFDSFKLYIIKCYDDNEVFYKIGKTFREVSKRFGAYHRLPYKFDIIKTITGTSKDISNMEKRLHIQNKLFKYTPNKRFNGMGECFTKIVESGN